MSGASLRLNRLFNPESGRAFITAFDHGITLGPKPGSEAAMDVLASIVKAGPDGILISPGMMKQGGHLFGYRGAPSPIVRGDWIYNHDVMKGLPTRLQDTAQGEHWRIVCTPEAALSMGAEALTMFLIVGTIEGKEFSDNVRDLAATCEAAARIGLPVIVESVLWGARMDDQRDAELLAFAARMAAELGADAIKTTFTGDTESMRQVIDGCPLPVLVLGGVRSPDPAPVIANLRLALEAGAKGVVYGRNVWQADDPVKMCGLLRDVIHGPNASF
ncbi:MAG: class I fructose-bisphosphate aldolase [Thermomicrobiales bacterium]